MDGKFIDMHIHTNFSDGVFTPSEVVEYASNVGLSAISITDHDSSSGINEALDIAKEKNVEFIPGIELSCQVENNLQKEEMHILGYFIDYKSEKLQKILSLFRHERCKRAIKILDKLKENNVILKDETFIRNIEGQSIGRMHFAKALVKENFANNIQEAFHKYLSYDKSAYVPKHYISAVQAIELILSIGGIPVMAHPYYRHYTNEAILKKLIDAGLAGIEAWHVKHTSSLVKKLLELANKFDLVVTGGSDCHGPFKKEKPLIGRVKVPYCALNNLKNSKKIN